MSDNPSVDRDNDPNLDKPLRDQAQDIIDEVSNQIVPRQQADLAARADTASASSEEDSGAAQGVGNELLALLFNAVSEADEAAAAERVAVLRAEHPAASPAELAELIVKQKVRQTGMIGAATSAASFIPGLGTLTSLTVGVAADIGATFKLQSEMVLEIAAAYQYPLDELEKQRIVMLVTGVSAGGNQLLRKGGEQVAVRLGRDYAGKAFSKALPVLGVAASAGTNVLSTYIIGQRAQNYFGLGPDAVTDWRDNLRAIVGVDERKIAGWLAESTEPARDAAGSGLARLADAATDAAGNVIDAGRNPRETLGDAVDAVSDAAGKVVGGAAGAARKVGGLLRRGEEEDAQLPPPAAALPSEEDDATTATVTHTPGSGTVEASESVGEVAEDEADSGDQAEA